jgi:hypothetical protein
MGRPIDTTEMEAGLDVIPDCERCYHGRSKAPYYMQRIVRSNKQLVNELPHLIVAEEVRSTMVSEMRQQFFFRPMVE